MKYTEHQTELKLKLCHLHLLIGDMWQVYRKDDSSSDVIHPLVVTNQ